MYKNSKQKHCISKAISLADFLVIFLLFLHTFKAGKLSTLDGAASHQVYKENATNENSVEAIAGVRTFTTEEGAEPRIVGGKEAWPHSWPWQVVLSFADMPACGGAIINENWIVTASHCFRRYSKESFWTVMAGKHDLENEKESSQQTSKVAKIINHEDYNGITKQHDIALMKLQTPLVFNKYVRPIPVWSGELPSLKRCTVTGWGSTTESGPRATKLQEVNITILETDTCLQFYGGVIRSSMMCAGEVTGGVDACQGDSGGPLSCFTGERFEIAGIVSWGVGCGRAKKPGVYTRVASYDQWISSNIDDQLGTDGTRQLLPASRKLPPSSEAAVKKCGQAEVKPCNLDQGSIGFETSDPSGELRVVNLMEACPHSWPWQVSLQSEENHYCSGTLIDERWVLTARHCRAEAGDIVVLGAHDLNAVEVQRATVKAVYSQPYDGSYPPLHDLSLLYLSVPARIGSSVFPVCLSDEDWRFDQGLSCVTTGWGYRRSTPKVSPDVLYQAQVNPLSEQACWTGWGQVFSSNALLCTQSAASSSCLGDAGAPLLCQKNGRYYLAGIMALGLKRCDQQKPAIFTNLSRFRSWIDRTMTNEGF
ncbi:ovochymase-1 isoform X1 [Hemibagrus wyckioides]|uniref:ovochymase-1 isoform X1 n=1 Tax=Hemibagrus wyckioides TaxID=337641 RepID=UPI00266D3704|nr:ovochymase-1 isoform X1 [Hemibagrus wyckioides]